MTLYENQIRTLKVEFTPTEREALSIVEGLLFGLYAHLDSNSRMVNTESGEVIEEGELQRVMGILSGLQEPVIGSTNPTVWEIKK